MPLIYQVDAFTDTPFSGNPAAVCLLDTERHSEWMQAVAAEMNLAETAFLVPRGDHYALRWFTPTVEVDLCGHATLASAHILWQSGRLSPQSEARFETRSGLLVCSQGRSGIEMALPADPTVPLQEDIPLHDILGKPFMSAHRGRYDWLVELASEEEVLAIKPELPAIAALPLRGLIITARGRGDIDFVSRFFAPGAGIDEDSVTGSAHCTLAGYWGERLGKQRMQAWQASARGGRLGVELRDNRVVLTGQAVTVLHGELLA